MDSLPGKVLELVQVSGATETVIARGRISGNLRIEDPDLLQGSAVWRRWRFTLLEMPASPLPTPPDGNVVPEPEPTVGDLES